MGVGAGLSMYAVVVQKFTFAISSPDEFLSSMVTPRLRALLEADKVPVGRSRSLSAGDLLSGTNPQHFRLVGIQLQSTVPAPNFDVCNATEHCSLIPV